MLAELIKYATGYRRGLYTPIESMTAAEKASAISDIYSNIGVLQIQRSEILLDAARQRNQLMTDAGALRDSLHGQLTGNNRVRATDRSTNASLLAQQGVVNNSLEMALAPDSAVLGRSQSVVSTTTDLVRQGVTDWIVDNPGAAASISANLGQSSESVKVGDIEGLMSAAFASTQTGIDGTARLVNQSPSRQNATTRAATVSVLTNRLNEATIEGIRQGVIAGFNRIEGTTASSGGAVAQNILDSDDIRNTIELQIVNKDSGTSLLGLTNTDEAEIEGVEASNEKYIEALEDYSQALEDALNGGSVANYDDAANQRILVNNLIAAAKGSTGEYLEAVSEGSSDALSGIDKAITEQYAEIEYLKRPTDGVVLKAERIRETEGFSDVAAALGIRGEQYASDVALAMYDYVHPGALDAAFGMYESLEGETPAARQAELRRRFAEELPDINIGGRAIRQRRNEEKAQREVEESSEPSQITTTPISPQLNYPEGQVVDMDRMTEIVRRLKLSMAQDRAEVDSGDAAEAEVAAAAPVPAQTNYAEGQVIDQGRMNRIISRLDEGIASDTDEIIGTTPPPVYPQRRTQFPQLESTVPAPAPRTVMPGAPHVVPQQPAEFQQMQREQASTMDPLDQAMQDLSLLRTLETKQQQIVDEHQRRRARQIASAFRPGETKVV